MPVAGRSARLGLSASNVVARGSDPALSCEFLLTRASHILRSPTHARETMPEFREDWLDLERASARNALRDNAFHLAEAHDTSALMLAVLAAGDNDTQ